MEKETVQKKRKVFSNALSILGAVLFIFAAREMLSNYEVLLNAIIEANREEFTAVKIGGTEFIENYARHFHVDHNFSPILFGFLGVLALRIKAKWIKMGLVVISALGMAGFISGWLFVRHADNRGLILSGKIVAYCFSDPGCGPPAPKKELYKCFKSNGYFNESCLKISCLGSNKKGDSIWSAVKLKSDSNSLGLKAAVPGYIISNEGDDSYLVKFDYKNEDPIGGAHGFSRPDYVESQEVEFLCGVVPQKTIR